MKDVFEIEILEDGTISVKTCEFSDVQHIAADNFIDALQEEIGGQVKKEKLEHPLVNKVFAGYMKMKSAKANSR